ncbi:isoaspartyl peptidase/L-asparaginase [Microbulbifer agarilyticus]|uniref:isoaspartyl peptidase/L-asparaginase family protein n=1 Tax=Microbulbifer agarilyticus TaxID=260552 RepID=UPI001C93B69B|nr:isoaspartyl peptidase/L-asparaginase [Microbulbifer agarilyticus]MBY6189548.1 isoaspartyl peptidase/L-asparaginase [Microbulbifer agarilyticus]
MKNLLLFVFLFVAAPAWAEKFGLVLHGGAGTITRAKLTDKQESEIRAKLAEARDAGYKVLEKGGSSIEAVTAAIIILEDSPLFNAGKGAVYTYDGQHELDASIMDGSNRNAGAVAGVKTVRNPILAAQAVMTQSDHVMLAGSGADAFARHVKLPQVENSYFDTEFRLQQLEKAKQKMEAEGTSFNIKNSDYKYGTVGVAALDKDGNLAAGTSTGGMTAKRWGRVGDSPIIGAGTWADNNSCAVSATGHGEYFIRYHVAADICSRKLYRELPLTTAAREVIQDILLPAGGTGGIVAMDRDGNIAMEFNTEGVYRAWRLSDKTSGVAIYDDEMKSP